MKLLSGERFLMIYSGVLTLALGVTILGGFTQAPKKTKFDEIDVHRINVVEPDGTLRMVVSDKAVDGVVEETGFRGQESGFGIQESGFRRWKSRDR